jgi:hypothetical protein
MSIFKTLSRYLCGILCLVCLTGIGQGWAVETIRNDWDLGQEIALDPQGGGGIRQVIVGWALQEVNTSKTVSIMNSFQNVKGTMSINQVTGDLNNLASLVMVNMGAPTGATLSQSPLHINSVIANNVLVSGSNTYRAVIGGGSFLNSQGIIAITQNAGNMNNISNVVGVSTQGASGLTLSNATLSDVSASNNVYKNLGLNQASAEIQSDAFKGFSGVGTVLQTVGNYIQVSSNVSVKINQ